MLNRVGRLFVTTAFIVWLFVGVPTPWTPGFGATFSYVAFNSRHILDASTSPEAPSVFFGFFRTLMQLGIKSVVFLVAFSVVWVCTLLMDMPKISPEALCSADQLLMEGVKCVEQESNWVRFFF